MFLVTTVYTHNIIIPFSMNKTSRTRNLLNDDRYSTRTLQTAENTTFPVCVNFKNGK